MNDMNFFRVKFLSLLLTYFIINTIMYLYLFCK